MKEIADVLRLAAELAPELLELIKEHGKNAAPKARVVLKSHLESIEKQRAANDAEVQRQIAAKRSKR